MGSNPSDLQPLEGGGSGGGMMSSIKASWKRVKDIEQQYSGSAGVGYNQPVKPAVADPSQKAKELMDKMDQMKQQGIGQQKPKVSSDFYKRLKDAGFSTNESKMNKIHKIISEILKEATPTSTDSRNLEKNLAVSRGSRVKYLQDLGLKGNAQMQKDLKAKSATQNKPVVSKNSSANITSAAAKETPPTRSMSTPDNQNSSDSMKQVERLKNLGSAEPSTVAVKNKPSQTIDLTAPKPESDLEKLPNTDLKQNSLSVVHTKVGDTNNKEPEPVDVKNDNEVDTVKATRNIAAATKPVEVSKFSFSPEQEKWLGKADRQDPYIIARMPGEKPPLSHFEKDEDKQIAKKINYGQQNLNLAKKLIGIKPGDKETFKTEEKQMNINKKFNVSDSLYNSVMEVMKKGGSEGSKPRNEKEKDLAAKTPPTGLITHGDVLKARGVKMKEEVEQVDENKDTPGNSYEHQCAIHVKSESYGEGRTITTQHADPDENGNIAWYDVMFEHGIEKHVPTNELEILVSESHMHMKPKKKKGMK